MAKDTLDRTGIESLQIFVNGHRIHYLKAGKGPPVVLVHGGASDAREWIPTMARFGDRFSLYAPDLPGFGKSERDEKGYYLTDFSDFLSGFINVLGLKNPALAGHSLGARSCLDVACKPGNNISRLILIDASGLGKVSTFGNALFNFFKWMRSLLGKPQPFPRFLAREGDNWDEVGDESLKNIKIPTLLIWKSADPYMPVSRARRAQALIPGARLEIISGYGHAPHQQNNKEPFNKVFLEFLDDDGGNALNR